MDSKVFVLIIIVFLTIGCKKKERPTYYMTQDFKNYVVFPVGSYWVYEDSITGEIDTIRLIESSTTIINTKSGDDDPGYNYEQYSANFISSISNETLGFVGGKMNNNSDIHNYVYGNYRRKLFISDIEIGFGYDNYVYEEYLDSIYILNIKYNRIKIFKNRSPFQGIIHSRTFNCKNIGIIRMEIEDTVQNINRVWNLKSHLIQN